MIPSDLIGSVKEISKEAGAAILEIYHREGDIEVTSKSDDSPLTEADLVAHKIIVSALKQLTPGTPILSEESANINWKERQAWTRYWLVDPLDGTKEFLKRNGEFTVNIALIDNHVPILGVVYIPVKNILYSGTLEQGAFKEYDGVEQEISVALTSEFEEVKIVASRSHRGHDLDAWIKKVEKYFKKVELLSIGSSLKICLVAEGKADIYPRLALTSEWDTAAAQAVLEAAGGALKDSEFNTYRYNQKENILNPFFFAIGDINFDWQRF
ncbi:MAG: 3'(2'),5'-bisphosphate nucleotidase CysQ [Pseudohongiellaceae bacterium]